MNKYLLTIKDGSTTYTLNIIEDILYVKAGGNYVAVYFAKPVPAIAKKDFKIPGVQVKESMTYVYSAIRIKIGELWKKIEELNVPHTLVKPHKSWIINLRFIRFVNLQENVIIFHRKDGFIGLDELSDATCRKIMKQLANMPIVENDVYIVHREDVGNIKTLVGTHSNHKYVDLGLPSGTLWASHDMSTPLGNLKVIMLYDSPMTEIENTYPKGSFESLLQLEEDTAKVEWGGNWRIPTLEEWKELLTECTPKWAINENGHIICILTAKNGNRIVLSSVSSHRGFCSYWTSTEGKSDREYNLDLGEWDITPSNCSVEIHEPYADEPWFHFVSDFHKPDCNLHAVISAKDLIEK